MEYAINSRLRCQLGLANKQTIVSKSTLTSSTNHIGIGITSFYKTKILTKLELDSQLRFFMASRTLEETDIVGKLSLTYPINSYIKWFYNFNIVYDADVSTMVQTQHQNTVGLSLIFK